MKFVILAGGKGSRLWPLSRKYFAKQFLNLTDEHSLLQNTALRVSKENGKDIFVISNIDSKFIINDQISEVLSDYQKSNLIIEPVGRNTAPAIAYGTLFFKQNDIIAILSSDHHIKNVNKFNALLEDAEILAEKGHIVTLGIVPHFASTGYGYIKKSSKKIDSGYLVEEFVEKPNLIKAREYLEAGNYYWNAGIFIFKISTFLKELEKNTPDVYQVLQKIKNKKNKDQEISINDFMQFKNISIDYALMEKTDKLVMLPGDFGWNDIGSFKALHEILEKDKNNNAIKMDNNTFINLDSENMLVIGKSRKIAAVNLKDLIVIDTQDALLIADNKRSEDVKTVYNYLDEGSARECEYHTRVYRPWGYYQLLHETEDYQVRKLYIRPLKKIVLQYHNHRSETWTVVKGEAQIILNETQKTLHKNESVFVPATTRHSIINPSNKNDLEIIEVQTGRSFGQEDIIRLENENQEK